MAADPNCLTACAWLGGHLCVVGRNIRALRGWPHALRGPEAPGTSLHIAPAATKHRKARRVLRELGVLRCSHTRPPSTGTAGPLSSMTPHHPLTSLGPKIKGRVLKPKLDCMSRSRSLIQAPPVSRAAPPTSKKAVFKCALDLGIS